MTKQNYQTRNNILFKQRTEPKGKVYRCVMYMSTLIKFLSKEIEDDKTVFDVAKKQMMDYAQMKYPELHLTSRHTQHNNRFVMMLEYMDGKELKTLNFTYLRNPLFGFPLRLASLDENVYVETWYLELERSYDDLEYILLLRRSDGFSLEITEHFNDEHQLVDEAFFEDLLETMKALKKAKPHYQVAMSFSVCLETREILESLHYRAKELLETEPETAGE